MGGGTGSTEIDAQVLEDIVYEFDGRLTNYFRNGSALPSGRSLNFSLFQPDEIKEAKEWYAEYMRSSVDDLKKKCVDYAKKSLVGRLFKKSSSESQRRLTILKAAIYDLEHGLYKLDKDGSTEALCSFNLRMNRPLFENEYLPAARYFTQSND